MAAKLGLVEAYLKFPKQHDALGSKLCLLWGGSFLDAKWICGLIRFSRMYLKAGNRCLRKLLYS